MRHLKRTRLSLHKLGPLLFTGFALFFSPLTAPAEDEPDVTQTPAVEPNTRYALAPFDQVSVSIYGQSDLSITQRISDAGAISMPLIGEVAIAGLTVAEAKQTIAQQFIDQEYLRDPLVIINLNTYTTNAVTLIGEVGSQGQIQLPVGVSEIEIQRLIAMAGGFTGIAKQDAVRVERSVPGSLERDVLTVDVERILNAKEDEAKALQFMVKAGDMVVVPRRIF